MRFSGKDLEAYMKFVAEIKQVKSKKTASLDLIYSLVLETNDPQVLGLGALNAETLVNVTVEAEK